MSNQEMMNDFVEENLLLSARVKELEAALTGSNELLQRYFDLFTDMKKRLEDSKTEEEQG